jgi:hypothetical protein
MNVATLVVLETFLNQLCGETAMMFASLDHIFVSFSAHGERVIKIIITL